MCLKGELLHDLGAISESIDVYRRALAAAPDDLGRCRPWIGLAAGLRVSEALAEALDLLDKAEEVASRHELVAELARIHHLRGNIYFPLGRIDGCREEHERGLACARQVGSPEAEARALGGLADAAYAQGRMHTAFGYFSSCVELSREHGFGHIEVANRSMIGLSRQYLNDLRGALEDGLEAAAAAARVGHQRAEMLGETMCVLACYELGEFDSAEVHREREMRLAQRLGARRFEAQNLEFGGRILFAQGRRADAARQLREGLALCREVGLQFSGPRAIGALAVATEGPAERCRLLEEGEALLRRGAVGANHLWFYRDAIEALLQAGDADVALRYAAALEAYTRPEPLPWSDLFIARARALTAVASSTGRDGPVRRDLEVLRKTIEEAGLRLYRPAIDCALDAIADVQHH
jgi:tetratricopeptide (TPR) repeat protein